MQFGEEVVPWRRLLCDLLVPAWPVDADGRGVHQHLRLAVGAERLAEQRLGDVVCALDPAIDEQLLERRVPATGENVLASEMDDGVAVVDAVHPLAGLHGIALDDRDLRSERLASRVSTPAEYHRLIVAFQQLADEPLAHQPRSTCHEDAHGLLPWGTCRVHHK